MTQRAGYLRTAAKLTLVATALMVATLFVGRGTTSVSASTTQIVLSESSFAPIPSSTIILYEGGAPTPIYVWAKDVDNPTGASAFQVNITYNGAVVDVVSLTGSSTWLGSSGRSASCPVPGEFDEEQARVGCVTVGGVPPYGATGTGLLAQMDIQAAAGSGGTSLNASTSYLVDTPLNPDDTDIIPLTINSPTVAILPCADFSGDSYVSLTADILPVVLRWQMTSSDPEWDPIFDLNGNGSIDLTGDILGTILQYQRVCTHA